MWVTNSWTYNGPVVRITAIGQHDRQPCAAALPATSAAAEQHQTLRVILNQISNSIVESFRLEKALEIESSCKANTAKYTNAPFKIKIPPMFCLLTWRRERKEIQEGLSMGRGLEAGKGQLKSSCREERDGNSSEDVSERAVSHGL